MTKKQKINKKTNMLISGLVLFFVGFVVLCMFGYVVDDIISNFGYILCIIGYILCMIWVFTR